jgi:hypothetical protein
MRIAPLGLAALALLAAGPPLGSAQARGPAQPVIVELFTAEGCSACPPADALLDRLARDQPVAGAEIVALELHVDYFDSGGSVDPFAQASFDARQAEYLKLFGKQGAYTPQLVVDGQREIVGAHEREVRDAVADAARAASARVQITRSGDRLSITLDGLADVGKTDLLDLMLAVTEEGLAPHALGGENRGRTGVHGPVVRELRKVSTVSGGAGSPVQVRDVAVNVDSSWRRENVRAVVFVQRVKTLEIVGAGMVSMQ